MKVFWTVIFILASIALYMFVADPGWIVAQAASCDNKCAQPPNASRPYYDASGNEYDALGNLIKSGKGGSVLPAVDVPSSTSTAPPLPVPGFKGK